MQQSGTILRTGTSGQARTLYIGNGEVSILDALADGKIDQLKFACRPRLMVPRNQRIDRVDAPVTIEIVDGLDRCRVEEGERHISRQLSADNWPVLYHPVIGFVKSPAQENCKVGFAEWKKGTGSEHQ